MRPVTIQTTMTVQRVTIADVSVAENDGGTDDQ